MKQAISKSGVYAVASRTIKTRKPEVVALMQKYGMAVNVKDSDGKIDKAFFALLPRSRGFRNDFSQLASEVAAGMTVGELSMTGYLNTDGAKDFNSTQVGQILSNDSIKNILNTGLSVWAYKKTGGSVGTPSDNILGSATLGTQTTPAPTDKPKDDKPKGTDLGWLVFVGIGLVVVGAGFVVYKSVNK